jgi:hypothetical protein
MTENTKFNIKDGMSTRPDVDALLKKWPELKPGDSISYNQIAGAIGCQINSDRFRTVTNAWRKRLINDHGIVVECERGTAFLVAPSERITSDTAPVVASAGRKLKKHRTKLTTIKPINPIVASTQLHQMRLLLALEKDVKRTRTNLLPDTVPQAWPQIRKTI